MTSVGVVTPLGGVAQVSLHGVKVVEVVVLVGVHEEGEKEKDGEVQVGVKGKSKRIKDDDTSRRVTLTSCMDEMSANTRTT